MAFRSKKSSDLIYRFLRAWELNLRPNVCDFLLVQDDQEYAAHALEICRIDVEWQVLAGKPSSTCLEYRSVQGLITLLDASATADLAALEFQAHWNAGLRMPADEFRALFPCDVQDELESLCPLWTCQVCGEEDLPLLDQASASTTCPICDSSRPVGHGSSG